MVPTACAICGPGTPTEEVYPANFSAADLNERTFSARRLPDRLHYRLVRCAGCGLVRSDPIAADPLLESLYGQSRFTYQEETANLSRSYARYLRRLQGLGGRREALLEIGCGNGFLLEAALKLGYRSVAGVEPSVDAVAQAPPRIAGRITLGTMRPGLFRPVSFDVVCMFQVLDHLAQPVEILRECRELLREGGLFLCLNHDVSAPSARALGEKSPIYDIEHTYLYNRRTVSRLLAQAGFEVVEVNPAYSLVSLQHLLWLAPMAKSLKRALGAAVRRTRLGRLSLTVPLGNLYAVARKPG